jgi:hypothetical protein
VATTLPVEGRVKVKCDPAETVMPVGRTLALVINVYVPVAAVAVAPKTKHGRVSFVDVEINAGKYL